MPSRHRPAMYNTPNIRNGGFGALQVEAVTNRPLSIARRHLAASQLRMRDIEPDELSSSEWVRFLVMEEHERDRWIGTFAARRRRGSDEESNASAASSSSARPRTSDGVLTGVSSPLPAPIDRLLAYDKAEEARAEAEDDAVQQRQQETQERVTGRTPAVSLWARAFDDEPSSSSGEEYTVQRPRHYRRALTIGDLSRISVEAPPPYDGSVRARTPPPAYQPRR